MESRAVGSNEGIPSFFNGQRASQSADPGRSACPHWRVRITPATHVSKRSGRARRCYVPRASPSGASGGCQRSSGSPSVSQRCSARRPAAHDVPIVVRGHQSAYFSARAPVRPACRSSWTPSSLRRRPRVRGERVSHTADAAARHICRDSLRGADVECPSLSPDNARIAYKQRTGYGRSGHVVDLGARPGDARTPTTARASQHHDQLHWLDDTRVLYARTSDNDVASTEQGTGATDGSGDPERYWAHAYSGTLVTPSGVPVGGLR